MSGCVEGFVGETEEKGVPVINATGGKTGDQDGGRVGGEGGMETVDISQVEK